MTVGVTEVDVQTYIEGMKSEFPGLTVSAEKSWWLKTVMEFPGFGHLDTYTQTIGFAIYCSSRWSQFSPRKKLSTLRHERKHLEQFRKYTFFGMFFLYIFVFFPIGLAWFRAKFEREGYAENCCSRVDYYGSDQDDKDYAWEMYKRAFLGWGYFKMWPYERQVRKWFEEDWHSAVSREV